MPDSPLYERLTAVAHLNIADQGTSDMDEIRSHIEAAKGIVARVRENPGITGMIKTAIEKKLDSYIALFETHEKNLTTLRSNHEAACNAMTEAVASFGTISASLISHHEMEEWHKGKDVNVADETIPGDTYYANLMEERNRQREEAAGAILDKMNNALNEAAELTVDSGNQGDGGGSGSAGSGGIGGGSHSSASSPHSMGAGGSSGGSITTVERRLFTEAVAEAVGSDTGPTDEHPPTPPDTNGIAISPNRTSLRLTITPPPTRHLERFCTVHATKPSTTSTEPFHMT